MTRQRINITLPRDTLQLLDRVAPKADRSRIIDVAVQHFMRGKTQTNLRKQLEEGYRVRASHDLKMSEEWFSID